MQIKMTGLLALTAGAAEHTVWRGGGHSDHSEQFLGQVSPDQLTGPAFQHLARGCRCGSLRPFSPHWLVRWWCYVHCKAEGIALASQGLVCTAGTVSQQLRSPAFPDLLEVGLLYCSVHSVQAHIDTVSKRLAGAVALLSALTE